MDLGELNAKKIETLTKVARLLGEQIQAQSRAINKLQNDVDWLKESFRRIIHEDSPPPIVKPPKVEEVTSDIFLPEEKSILSTADEQTETITEKKDTSEKEELLQALKVIDKL